MQSSDKTTNPAGDILVIGYGNMLRGDDGLGPRVTEALSLMNFPWVQTVVCQLLTPELADPVAKARVVVFVDASLDAPHEVRLRPLGPNESSQIMAHSADPRTLLALARDVFGHAPQAWWLTIPATKLDFDSRLSPEAQIGFVDALEKLLTLCQSLQRS